MAKKQAEKDPIWEKGLQDFRRFRHAVWNGQAALMLCKSKKDGHTVPVLVITEPPTEGITSDQKVTAYPVAVMLDAKSIIGQVSPPDHEGLEVVDTIPAEMLKRLTVEPGS